MAERPTNQVNLLDFLAFLLRWRKFLIITMLAVTVAVAIISLVVTPKYRSEALLRTSTDSGDSFGGFVASKLSALSSMVGMPGMGGEVPGEIAIAILESRWMSERMIKEFDLRSVYNMPDVPIEHVIDMLKANTTYELDVISSTITILVDDADPVRAQKMATFLVDELDKRNRHLKSAMAGKEKQFVETRLNEARQELAALEDSMFQFQTRTGVLNVEEQVKASIQAAATLEAQRLATVTQLELNRQMFRAGSPEVEFLRMQVASIDSSLQDLVSSREKTDADFDYILRLQETPRQGLAYLRLMRDLEIQQLLVGFLVQQYEQSKIEEVRNTPTIVRLDDPTIATVRTWPRRGLMVGLAAFGSLFFGAVIALIIDFFRNANRDPEHPQHAQVMKLRQAWHRVEA